MRWPTTISRLEEGLSGRVRLRQNLGRYSHNIRNVIVLMWVLQPVRTRTFTYVFMTSLVFTFSTAAAVYAVVQLIDTAVHYNIIIPIDIAALLMGTPCVVL